MTAIRSAGASFPVASSIVNGWNEVQSRLEHERIEKFINHVMARLDDIELSASRTQEDMAKMFYYVMNYATKDPQTEKVSLYAGGLIEYYTREIESNDILNLVQELETLNTADIEVLQKLSSGKRIDEALRISDETELEDISSYQVSVKKLESKALIGTGGSGGISFHRVYHKHDSWPFTFLTQHYTVLHSGRLILRLWIDKP